jgi:hypothetical protein
VIKNVFVALPNLQRFATQNNIMSSPQDALNIATAASVQALAAALQQHTLQPALQTMVTLPPF